MRTERYYATRRAVRIAFWGFIGFIGLATLSEVLVRLTEAFYGVRLR
jgi:hypothetical protein